jgi:hypothetical protein
MELSTKMCGNELRKTALLITEASRLGMDLSGYGNLDVNRSNGNVYLWLEDYPFSLFIDLGSDDVQVCWSSCESDWEEFNTSADKTLYDLEQWASDCVKTEQSYNAEMGA